MVRIHVHPVRRAEFGEPSGVSRRVGPSGDVAQLGERRLCKPEVEGSIPFVSIKQLNVVSEKNRKRSVDERETIRIVIESAN